MKNISSKMTQRSLSNDTISTYNKNPATRVLSYSSCPISHGPFASYSLTQFDAHIYAGKKLCLRRAFSIFSTCVFTSLKLPWVYLHAAVILHQYIFSPLRVDVGERETFLHMKNINTFSRAPFKLMPTKHQEVIFYIERRGWKTHSTA